jgi:general secretion pathway protein E
MMRAKIHGNFVDYLTAKKYLPANIGAAIDSSGPHSTGGSILRSLWKMTELSSDDFADEVARFYQLPRIDLPTLMSRPACVAGFAERFLRETMVFPYRSTDGCAILALTDPRDESAIRAAEIVLGEPIKIEVASFEDIVTILNERLGEEGTSSQDIRISNTQVEDDIDSLRDLASGAPVVRAVNDLFEKALDLRASDIHIEPFRTALVIRMRVDGLLRTIPTPAGAPPQAVISRLKILTGLNIAERRLPQDGGGRVRIGQSEVDIRVAIMPTHHGESAAIRLLVKDRGLLDIGSLGLSVADENKLSHLLGLPHGMIVVTGPTGSGKTTTLATMLSILNEPTRKILTIEDPIEYEISGINQSQIKPSVGLTFATALRAFVRQDPDVIMVGEIRDAETAHIAIHAALTGHLVLTTLHTETAAAAVPRLLDLGVEAFLLRSTLRAVIAQRLVRVLCDRCKITRTLSQNDTAADARYQALGFRTGDVVYEPGRCERCSGVGYRGRKGIFEILEMNSELRSLVGSQTDASIVERAAVQSGMTTMDQDAIAKCHEGITSPAEVLRVIASR